MTGLEETEVTNSGDIVSKQIPKEIQGPLPKDVVRKRIAWKAVPKDAIQATKARARASDYYQTNRNKTALRCIVWHTLLVPGAHTCTWLSGSVVQQ
jgi:hypothetical protein